MPLREPKNQQLNEYMEERYRLTTIIKILQTIDPEAREMDLGRIISTLAMHISKTKGDAIRRLEHYANEIEKSNIG